MFQITRDQALYLGLLRCKHCGFPPNNHFDFPPRKCAHTNACPGYLEKFQFEKKEDSKYHGISHGLSQKQLQKWRREKCPSNIHAFDEVFSDSSHYLSCDACRLVVEIAKIDKQYVTPIKAKATTK